MLNIWYFYKHKTYTYIIHQYCCKCIKLMYKIEKASHLKYINQVNITIIYYVEMS